MTRSFGVALALAAALATTVLATDVTGRWEGTVQGPQGEFSLVFNFTVEGETLGGTVDGPGGTLDITNGIIKGDEMSFNVILDSANTITHEGKIGADSIAIKAHAPWGDSEYTLKRTENK
jgi:hypothetical protein